MVSDLWPCGTGAWGAKHPKLPEGFNRMSKDSELTVIRGCGINFWRIIIMPIILGIIFAITCFFVCDRMIPYSNNVLTKIKKEFHSNHFVYAIKDDENNLMESTHLAFRRLTKLRNHYRHTGSCKNSRKICTRCPQLPPTATFLYNCNTISKSENWHWYNIVN